VDERGSVTRAELVEKTGPVSWSVAAEPALQAARAWRFEPARRDGRPVPSSALVTFRFNR